MTAQAWTSPLVDAYRLAGLVAQAAAQCPELLDELVQAQHILEDAEAHGTKDERRFAGARVEGCEQALVADCPALREAAGLGRAR